MMIVIDENPSPNQLPIPTYVKSSEGDEVPIEITKKRQVLWSMHLNMKCLFGDIHHTTYGNYSFVIDFGIGGVYRYNNDDFELLSDGINLYLRRIRGKKDIKLVFDGVFHPTKSAWLMESCQKSGSGKYPCFTLFPGKPEAVIIRDHQAITIMREGAKALIAIGVDRIDEINHLDKDRDNRSLLNLEVGSKRNNRKHRDENLERKVLVERKGEIVFADWVLKKLG